MTNLDETKKKETVRISKKDLLKLLSENEHMTKQITELQTRMTRLVEENRTLKLEKITGRNLTKKGPVIDEEIDDVFPRYEDPPFPDPNIYFDGSNGIDRYGK